MKLFHTSVVALVSTLSAVFAFASDAHAQNCTVNNASHISRTGYTAYLTANSLSSSNAALRAYASSIYDVASLGAATFDGTNFTDAELGQLYSGQDGGAGFQATVSTSGVSGTFTLSNANTDAALSGLISRSCTGAVITVNASGIVDPSKIQAIDTSIAKVDFLTNMPATMTITAAATELTGSIVGSGTVAISGSLTTSVDLTTNIGSGVTLTFPTPYTVTSPAILTLTAAQANGTQMAGTGTVAIATTTLAAGTYDFDGITANTTMTATAGTGVVLQITAAQSGTMTVNPDGANFASATITGTAGIDTVPAVGINAIRTISGLAAADTLNGSGQADSITGGAGNDTIIGGDGVDTAVYSGDIGTISGTTTLTVGSSNSAADGSDTVSGVETLDFANGDVRVINTAGSSYGSLASFLSSNPSNTDKLFGALEITSTTFANGPTSADSLTALNTLLGRMVTNSVITVNVLGMNSNQLNALVNPGVASNLPAITYPPFKVTAGTSIQAYFSDLTSAVAGANAGETISISPGTYNQTASVAISKNLTITRNGSSGTVTIADTSAGAGVQKFIAVSGSAVVNFSNITFVGGSGTSSRDVINFFNTSSGTITDCVITASTGGSLSYGIFGQGSGLVTVSGTTFSPSTANNWVGVIVAGGCSVTNCTFSGAAALGSGKSHIGVSVSGGNATITGGSITGCASITSGGVYTISGGTVAITGADLSGNYRGVMGANASGAISASSCNFSNNTYIETSTNSDFRNNFWGTTNADAIAAIALDNIRFSPFSTTSAHSASMNGPVRLMNGQDRSYSTIQAALDASATTSSSTVLIGAGNYNEAPIIKDSGVTVQVASGAYGGTTGTTPLVFTLDGTLAVGVLDGGAPADLIGNTANNTLTGNGAANTISGGDGADTINSDAGADIVNGGAGNDTIDASAGNDTANGGDGNDVILGDSGSDTLNGDAGNDTMTGGSQNDTINGGASGVDVDTARFTGNLGTISGSGTLSVASSDSSEGTDTVSNVEIIDYANADVVIVGRAGSSIADLNTALSTYTGSQKFWGDLTINSSTNFSTSGEFAAIYARLVSGGSTIAVNMSGMSANQIAAVNANYATASASLTSAPIFIKRGGNDVGQAPTIQTAIDYATAGDTIEITAASYSQATTLSVSKNLTIARRGSSGTVTITDSSSGTGIASLVDISGSAVVSLSNLSFVGGSGTSSAQVINSGASASVTVTGCSITSCAGSDVNYGINAAGSVTVANSTLLAGDASRWVGVSMNNGGSVSGSTITGNAPLAPGSVKEHIGVSVVSGTVTITGGAITGCDNGASSFGVAVSGGTATLSGTDLSSNYYAVRATGGTVSAAGCNFTDSERVETTSDSNFTSNFWGTTVANDIAARAIGTIRFSPYSTTSAHSATAEGAVVLTGQGRSYSTIQAALDASATTSSSTVSVSAGNYNETPVIMDSGLTVSVATGAYSGSTGTDPLTFTLDGSLASATLADSGAANATGNTAANSITGNAGVNVLSGGDAADTLSGGAGADTLNGDAGNDSLVGGDGNDAINGGTGDDSMNGGAGDDTLNGGADASEVDTAVFTGDLGTITGSGPLSVTTSNSAADGTDSVANAEVLDFGDVEVVVVGRGSAFANLNAALASSVSTGRKFWGNLEINSSTVFSSAADFTAIYNRLVTSGSTFTINMTGMSQDQVNAVNASYSTVAGNINTTFGPITISRLVSSVSTVVGRAPTIERAIGFATIGDTVTLPEGEFDITSRLDLYRITLEGAGSGSIVGGAVSGGSIIDYSGLTMAANDCAVKFLGDGSVLRNVAITARGRTGDFGRGFAIAGSGPQGDPNSVSRNVTISNVRVHDSQRTAFDMNTVVGGTISDITASTVAAGYGVAFSGGSSNLAVSNVTVSNSLWGDVAVFPYQSVAPSGLTFSGTLNITGFVVQPGSSTINVSVPAGNQRYSATAQMYIPAAFNRELSVYAGASRVYTRQADLAAVQLATTQHQSFPVPYTGQTVTNILGDFEVVSDGVAQSGHALFADAVAAASNNQTVNVWTSSVLAAGTINTQPTPAITIGSDLTKTIVVTGAVNLTSTSFTTQAQLNWFAPLVASGANFVVELQPMSDSQLNWTVVHEARFDTINGKDWAVYNAGASAVAAALDMSGYDMTAYNALPNAGSFLYQSAASADLVANRGSISNGIPAAQTLFGQLIDFRGKAYTLLNAVIVDDTMSTSPTAAAYAQVRDALALLRNGTTATRTLTDEDVISTAMTTALSNYASRQASGRAYLRSVMNTARTASATVTAVNTASVNGFDAARAADTIAAGINSSTSTADIANAYLYQSTVAPFVTANMSGTSITLINAGSMNAASLNAVAAGAAGLAPNSIRGTFTIDDDVSAANLDAILEKADAANSTVTIDATGMSGDYFTQIVANINAIDHITNLSIDRAVAAADITTLLSKATLAAGSFPHITMSAGANSMSLAQIAAVNGSVAKVGLVTGYTVRVLTGSTAVHYNLYVDDRTASSVSYPGAVSAANTLKAANSGNAYVVRLEAGTFALENVLTLGSITLEGAGSSGTPATWATKITPPAGLPAPVGQISPTNLIAVTGSGATVRGVHLEGYMVSGVAVTRGIAVASGTSITGLTIDNVLTSLHQYGFGVLDGGSATTVAITNSKFAAGGNGIQVEASGSLNGLTMSGTELSGNLYGFSSSADPSVATAGAPASTNSNTTGLTNVTVSNCQFNSNSLKGLYFEKLNAATFTGITVDGNGVSGSPAAISGAGFELNLKYGTYSNITITNATVTGNGVGSFYAIPGTSNPSTTPNGIGLAIKARDDAAGPSGARYNDKPSSVSNVTVNGGSITGSARNLSITNNVVMNTVTFGLHSGSALAIGGNVGKGVEIFGTVPSGPLNLGAVSIGGDVPTYIENGSTCAVTATGASFGGANGATATDAQLFAIERKVAHKVDLNALGFVSVKANNVFVSSANTVALGVGAASTGNIVNVEAGNYASSVVTVNTEDLTINGAAPAEGAHGYSFLMGTANNLTLAGTALIDATGNGAGNSLTGSGVANVLAGDAGADTMNGDAGADTMNGGADADVMNGGADADTMNGDAGADTMNGDAGADTMNGGADADVMNGGADADSINGDAGADTMNGDAGADTMNGGADADVMSGGADADSINGDAGNDSMSGGAGNDTINGGDAAADVDSAVFLGNLGAISGSGPLTVTSSDAAADGSDTVSNVEVLDFANADVVIVGRGGSSFASLDAALTASSADKKFWGNLVITQASFTDAAGLNTLLGRFVTGNSSITVNGTGMNSTQRAAVAQYYQSIASASNLTLTSADLAADITTLLNESTSNDVIVQMAAMNPDQIAAVNAGLARVATVNGSTVTIKRTADSVTTVVQYDLYLDTRNGFAGFPGAVERANVLEAGDSANAYAVEMTAGTFALQSKIRVEGIALVGAGQSGAGASVIDMTNAPMSYAQGSAEQGINVQGPGGTLRDFRLVSTAAAESASGASFGIKTQPVGAGNPLATGILIENVTVTGTRRSALDLNGAVNTTVRNVTASGYTGGYGLAISGNASNVTIDGFTTSDNLLSWGDIAVYPYLDLAIPTGITLTGSLNITALTVQPAGSALSVSVAGSDNQRYNAAAQITVPASFNRMVSMGAGAQTTQLVTRQASLAGLQAALVVAGVPTAAQTVTNILGDFEVVSSNVALAGRATLDAAITEAVNGNSINVWPGSAVSLGAVITKTITITGSVALTNASFATDAILDSLVAKVASSATFSVALTSMNDGQINRVQFNKAAFDTISDQLWAVNNAGAPGIISALDLGGVSLVGYNALPELTGFLYQSAAKSDMTGNARAFGDVAAAGTQWDKYVGFRSSAYALLSGGSVSPIIAGDFLAGGRFVAVKDARAALDGRTLTGETVVSADLASTITNFNGYAASGKAYLLASMNGARTSVTAVNAAASGINLDKARAADTIAAGINSSTSTTDIANAYLYQLAVAPYVTANMSGNSITLINAGGMNAASLNAIAAGASGLAANSIKGVFTITSEVSASNLDAILEKADAADSTVTIDAAGMGADHFAQLVANIDAIDSITNLTLTSAVVAADIGTLLGKATGAIVNATGMAHSGSAGDQLNAVAANLGSIATNGIRGTVNLSNSTNNLGAFLDKCSQLSGASASLVTVNASGMSDTKLTTLSSKIANIDSITSLTIASAQSATEIENLLTKSVDALVIATDMAYSGTAGDQLNAVAAGTTGIASNGIRGSAAVSSSMNSANLAAFLSKCSVLASPDDSTVTVDATGITASFDVLAAGIAAIDTINNLSLTSTQTAATITALLTKSVGAVANATSMNPARLTALGGGASGLATDGVTGDLYITVTVSNITALLGKTAAAANVEVSAAAANAGFKSEIALSANIAKIDTISSLALASSEDAAEIASLLTKALSASANATGMLADQLTALGAGVSTIATDGITGTLAIDVTVGNLGALLGKTAAAATVNVNAAQGSLSSSDYAAFKGFLSTNIGAVDAITNVALASSEDTTEIGNILGKSSAASANATDMSQAQLTALGAGASAISVDGITGTLAIDVTVGNLGALLDKTAVGATANVNAAQGALTAVNYASFKASLVSNISKVDSITSLALASSEDAAAITALLSKCANLGATADASGMDADRLNAMGAASGKLADDGISGIFTITNSVNYVGAILGKTQVAATVTVNAAGMGSAKLDEVAANSAKVDFLINATFTASADISLAELQILFDEAGNGSVLVVATGMNADYLNVVAANSIKVADNGISGTMIVTAAIVDANLGNLLAKASDSATVEIDASGMANGELADVVTYDSKVDSIYNLTVTNAQTAAQIGTLLAKSVSSATTGKAMALAVATGMDAAKLNALGVASVKLAASGVSGTVVFTSSVLNANMGNLFAGKIAAGATVDVDAASMVANQLSTVASNIAQVASTYNVSLTSVQTAAEIDALLSKAVSSATTGKALAVAVGTSMSSAAGNQLAKLADNYLKVALNGITGNLTVSRGLTATQITNLVSRISTLSNFTGGSTVVFNAADMSNDQLASLAAAVTSLGVGIVDITSLTVTAAQSTTQLELLLSAATTGQATVVATGMTSAQLSELATNSTAITAITGVVNIDSNVDPAAIAVIMNTSVSSGANVNVDPTGFNAAQQQAYNNALAVQALFHVTDQSTGGAGHTYVKANETFVIYVRAENLPTSGPRAVAAQGRINYDSSRLTFVSLAGGADMPTLLTGGDGVTGTQRHVTFYTGIDYTNAANVGIYEGVVATITFRATVDGFCSASDLCSLNSSFANRLAAGGTVPAPIAAIGTTSVEVSAQKNLALSGVPTGTADATDGVDNMSYYADATSTTGAYVADPAVTSANNCGAETVTISIAYPNSTTGTSWPTEFPIGTSRVTWSTIDEAGNTASAQRDIIVINKHLMTVNVDLAPTISAGASFTLPIRFRLSSGTAVTADVTFSATGDGAVRDVEIPVLAGYTCATAKDPINTLAHAQAMSISGTKWVFPGAFSLVAGDGTDDNVIDILDFGAFVTDRGANKTALNRSNFNRDGVVNNADFGFISLGFLDSGDNCNGANYTGNPRERVSVKELRRMGLGYMEEADINGDGWVDVTDVALAGQGQYRRPIEGLDEADGLEQPNW